MNTPLGALKSNLALLQRAHTRLLEALRDEHPERAVRALDAATSIAATNELAVERMAGFVRSVTKLAGVDDAPAQAVDLAGSIDAVFVITSYSIHYTKLYERNQILKTRTMGVAFLVTQLTNGLESADFDTVYLTRNNFV